MHRSSLVVALAVALVQSAFPQAQKQDAKDVDGAVRSVLQAQVEAWNHHDLEQFMAGYWNSPNLTFFSGTSETQGWEPTLQRYRQRYQSEGRAMGTLSFNDLQVQPLSADSAFVRGKFHLLMPGGKQPHGLFTLIFRKFPQGWRIIHDHTCAE